MKNISKTLALDVSHLTVLYQPTSLHPSLKASEDTVKLRRSGNNPVLEDVSVTIPQGVMCGIIGPNGAGKTTFIKAILDLIPVAAGNIKILGTSLQDARQRIAYIPQRSSVDWDFPITVFDMVLMGCYGKLGWFRRPSAIDHDDVHKALKVVGLESYAHASIGTLSGGQQQRAFLARALMQDAHIYFLDEPFAGVDITTEHIIINLFKKLRDEGKTVIVVHHDLFTAPTYFDYVMLLNKSCVASGPTEQVLTQAYLNQTYGTGFATLTWSVVQQKSDQL